MASVVIQNILSLGTPFANNITKNAYRAVFTLNNINMSVVNSMQISDSQHDAERVCNILENIDNRLSYILSQYNSKSNIGSIYVLVIVKAACCFHSIPFVDIML